MIPSDDFRVAAAQGCIEGLRQIWTVFSEMFNSFMAKNGMSRRIEVAVDDETGALSINLFMVGPEPGRKGIVAVVQVMPDLAKGCLSCMIDLDPHMQSRTNEDPQDGTLLTESFHPLDPESVQLLKRKIFANIMAGVDPLEGGAFLAHYQDGAEEPARRHLH